MVVNCTSLRQHWPESEQANTDFWFLSEVRCTLVAQRSISIDLQSQGRTAAWGPPVQQGLRVSMEGWPRLEELQVWSSTWLSHPRVWEMRSSKTFSCWKVRNVICLLESHMEVAHSPFISINFLDAVTRVTMALDEVPAIIVGDMQGNPAEQSDQMSIALRRGWLADEGWEHRSRQTGCPAPPYISGGAETRIDFVVTNRFAHGMFRKFRVDEHSWVPTHRATFFEVEARLFSSCNEESVPVLRWMPQKVNCCGTRSRLCGMNTSMESLVDWKFLG